MTGEYPAVGVHLAEPFQGSKHSGPVAAGQIDAAAAAGEKGIAAEQGIFAAQNNAAFRVSGSSHYGYLQAAKAIAQNLSMIQ